MPIFERALSWYPEEARFLLDEIQKTMDALEVEFGLDTTS
jgi:hypothetical protein